MTCRLLWTLLISCLLSAPSGCDSDPETDNTPREDTATDTGAPSDTGASPDTGDASDTEEPSDTASSQDTTPETDTAPGDTTPDTDTASSADTAQEVDTTQQADTTQDVSGSEIVARDSARVMFIGHSLIDDPMPHLVKSLADDAGVQMDFQTQIIIGAPLFWNWDNSTQGKGRYAETGDARDQLQNGFTVDGQARPGGYFDTLVMTEGIPLPENTITYMGRFHDCAVRSLCQDGDAAQAVNEDVYTYLFATWTERVVPAGEQRPPYAWFNEHYTEDFTSRELSFTVDPDAHRVLLDDSFEFLDQIDRWRGLWEAKAQGFNETQLQNSKPMALIPGNLVLKRAIEAIEAGEIPGLTSRDVLFSDNIHMSPTGVYLMALTHFSTIFRRSPVGLTHTLTDQWGGSVDVALTSEQAAALQAIVWEVVSGYAWSGLTY